MNIVKMVLVLLPLFISNIYANQSKNNFDYKVFHWYCNNQIVSHILDIEVKHDASSALIYKSQMPICSSLRNDIKYPNEHKIFIFYANRPNDLNLIRFDIWLAGAEQEGLLLGYSSIAGGEPLNNTLHPALLSNEWVGTYLDGYVLTTKITLFNKVDWVYPRSN